jgi:hypothetical protein
MLLPLVMPMCWSLAEVAVAGLHKAAAAAAARLFHLKIIS